MNLEPQKGRLLIAEPSILNDVSFKRSLVLLTEHTDKSSVGFILNKPTEYTLKDLLNNLNCDFPIFNGGPVEQDNLYFIHRIPDLLEGSLELSNGIYWGGNFDQLQSLINNQAVTKDEIRFFLGYSGWGTNQLETEINSKSWFIAENTYKNILRVDVKTIWKKELLAKGGEYPLWSNAPNDINMN